MRLRWLEELVAVVAPPACVACARSLPAAHELLCPACRRELPWMRGPRCCRCGLPAPCRPCPASGAAYDEAWAPMAYSGSARTVVGALKFRGSLAVADLMAAQIAAGVPGRLVAGATLVPVPLHGSRRRARGFNQAERLAAALARRLGVPASECLVRGGVSSQQLGAGRSARLQPERLAVAAREPVPERAVLVDDVHTTGATFQACARALHARGSRSVACVAYARTLRG